MSDYISTWNLLLFFGMHDYYYKLLIRGTPFKYVTQKIQYIYGNGSLFTIKDTRNGENLILLC